MLLSSQFLRARAPDAGVDCGGRKLPFLLYADDLTLLSADSAGLQRALDALSDFCGASGLAVNVSKSKIVAFSSAPGGACRGATGCFIPRQPAGV